MYKPLHDSLIIKVSGIDGIGLFAKKYIPKETTLGISHLKINNMLIRTPLGGFINHSDTPNCMKNKSFITNADNIKIKHDYIRYDLITLKDIQGGEELTVKYTFYNIKKKEIKTPSEKSQDELEPIGNVNAPMMELE